MEVGRSRPTHCEFDAFSPFQILWVITNGTTQRNFLWITMRKTGLYVAFGRPGLMHTSYHSDGRFQWKSEQHTTRFENRPPLGKIQAPILVQSSTTGIADDALNLFQLPSFEDKPVDKVVYLDNRMLPEAVFYQVWAVPPFRHGEVPLTTDNPAHIHVVTHTNPWIAVIIYEQGTRVSSPCLKSKFVWF